VLGLVGVIYTLIVARRMRKQTAYLPVFEDQLFHVLLPLAAYAMLIASFFSARYHVGRTLFGIGTAALLLLFVGIHNAWDAVTYNVLIQRRKKD